MTRIRSSSNIIGRKNQDLRDQKRADALFEVLKRDGFASIAQDGRDRLLDSERVGSVLTDRQLKAAILSFCHRHTPNGFSDVDAEINALKLEIKENPLRKEVQAKPLFQHQHKVVFERYAFDAEYGLDKVQSHFIHVLDIERVLSDLSPTEIEILIMDDAYRAEKDQEIRGYLSFNREHILDIFEFPKYAAAFQKRIAEHIEDRLDPEAQILRELVSGTVDVEALQSLSDQEWFGTVVSAWVDLPEGMRALSLKPEHLSVRLKSALLVSMLKKKIAIPFKEDISQADRRVLDKLEVKYDMQDHMLEIAVKDDTIIQNGSYFDSIQNTIHRLFGPPNTFHLHISGRNMSMQRAQMLNIISYYEGWKQNPNAKHFYTDRNGAIKSKSYGFHPEVTISKNMVRQVSGWNNHYELRALPDMALAFDYANAELMKLALNALNDDAFIKQLEEQNPDAVLILQIQAEEWQNYDLKDST